MLEKIGKEMVIEACIQQSIHNGWMVAVEDQMVDKMPQTVSSSRSTELLER